MNCFGYINKNIQEDPIKLKFRLSIYCILVQILNSESKSNEDEKPID